MSSLKATRALCHKNGFALVVTLSLMVLLTIIAVGLLALSSISLRTSSQGEAGAVARANARMALMLAIGELQREMGPDSRISAPFDAGKDSTGGQPHWTAVYDAWRRPEDPNTPESPQTRTPTFRSWLVSGASNVTGETALLVGGGSLNKNSRPEDEVRVPTQAIKVGNQQGKIAWWASDESAKAKVNAGPDAVASSSFGVSDPLFHSQSPPHIGHRTFPKLAKFEWKDGDRVKALSPSQVNLAAGLGLGELGDAFHDLTVNSAGLLTDVRSGRLKRDLSNFLSRSVTECEDKPLYLANGKMNRFVINESGAVSNPTYIPTSQGLNTVNEWGINMEELHLFHNIHRELNWSGREPSLKMMNSREKVVNDRYFIYKRPVIDAVQFILSLKAEPSGGPGEYRMVAMLDGMIALSNPCDVPIVWPPGLIFPVQLQNVPYSLTWNIQKANGSKNTNTGSSSNFGLFVGRIGGGTSQQAQGFKLEPGEAAVFGSTVGSGPQLDLFRGFVPSGGVRINPKESSGWDLKATGLKATDLIDFTLTKGDYGYQGGFMYNNTWIGDRRTGPNPKGWQIGACSLNSGGDINSERMNQLLISPIRPPQVRPVSDFVAKPQPFLMISFLHNVEQNSGSTPPDAFASRAFQLGDPTTGWSGYSPSSVESDLHAYQQLITAEPLNYQFRTLAAGDGGRYVYQGGGRQPNLGGSFHVIRRRIPIAPPLSFGAFEQAITSGFTKRFKDAPAIAEDPIPSNAVAFCGQNPASPRVSRVIGNSLGTPFLGLGQVYRAGSGSGTAVRTVCDHSWMANTALWDTWLLSGIVDGTGKGNNPLLVDSRSPRAQFKDLANGIKPLRNKRYLFHPHKPVDKALEELFSGENFKPAAISTLAKYLLIDGAFNVNSTSVKAWAALLSSVRDQEVIRAGGNAQAFNHPFGTLGYASDTSTTGTAGDWVGLRDLSEQEITKLAETIVEEVKARGPFLSLADFVNRRPNASTPQHQALGALQAAIDKSDLNSRFTGMGRSVAASDFGTLSGSSSVTAELAPARAFGSAGHLTQAKLLTAIGSQITVRSDTFVIRTYGDARDASGKINAKAWCEAVVQRVPEYLDPTNPPEYQDGWPNAGDKLSPANSRFGRRWEIKSFRWLSSKEVLGA